MNSATTILVMGVSGSGKSTLGQAIAQRLNWEFVEGDAYHTAENIALMSAGIPLTDSDRMPWLLRLSNLIREREARRQSTVLACSALKLSYREQLRSASGRLVVICVNPAPEILRGRLNNRRGHFMPASLLDSQLALLELPVSEIDTIIVSNPEAVDVDQLCVRLIEAHCACLLALDESAERGLHK